MKKLIVAVVVARARPHARARRVRRRDGDGSGGTRCPDRRARPTRPQRQVLAERDRAGGRPRRLHPLACSSSRCNRRARAYKGDVVTLTVTATTKLYRRTVDGELVAITLADFKAGDRVRRSASSTRPTRPPRSSRPSGSPCARRSAPARAVRKHQSGSRAASPPTVLRGRRRRRRAGPSPPSPVVTAYGKRRAPTTGWESEE